MRSPAVGGEGGWLIVPRPDPKPGTPAPVAGVRWKAAFLAPFDLPPARTRFEIGNHTHTHRGARKAA